jgi:glycerol kinase
MIQEMAALGAAYLAGLAAGVYPEPAKFADNWRLQHRFKPAMSAATRERKLKGWARAVKGCWRAMRRRGRMRTRAVPTE